MILSLLKERLEANRNKIFLINPEGRYSYEELLKNIAFWQQKLIHLPQGSVVVHQGSFELNNIGLMLALAEKGCILVPVSSNEYSLEKIISIAKANYLISPNKQEIIKITDHKTSKRQLPEPGIVFFTSGTGAKPKAALHDLRILLQKYAKARKAYCTCAVLLFDHLAGFDNLFYVLFSGGSLVVPVEFKPASVINCILENEVQLLSTTPSFLNFMILQGEKFKQALLKLDVLVFSSEKMPDSTLEFLKQLKPDSLKLVQKYGSTETGSPSSRTNPNNPQMIKFDSQKTPYKIVEGVLYIKHNGSFRGYLNHDYKLESWYCTGDIVIEKGEWLQILGRQTEMINVGGRKVLPQEVESVLLAMSCLKEVTVTGVKHKLMGQAVQAEVVLNIDMAKKDFIKEMRSFCKDKLASYKIPVYINIRKEIAYGSRLKKMRGRN